MGTAALRTRGGFVSPDRIRLPDCKGPGPQLLPAWERMRPSGCQCVGPRCAVLGTGLKSSALHFVTLPNHMVVGVMHKG